MTSPHAEPKTRVKEARQLAAQRRLLDEVDNRDKEGEGKKKEDPFAQFESRFDKEKLLTPFFKTVSRDRHFFAPNYTIETPGPNLYRPKPVLKHIHSVPNFGRDLQSKILSRKILDTIVRNREATERSKEPTVQDEQQAER